MSTRAFPALALAALALSLGAPRTWAGYTADVARLIQAAEPWPAEVPVPPIGQITHDMYRATAEIFVRAITNSATYWLQQPAPYPNMSFHVGHALWLGRIYALTGDETYAGIAAACLDHAHRLITEPQPDIPNTRPSWDTVRQLYWVDRSLQQSPSYTPARRESVRDIAREACPGFPAQQVEYGAFNRPFGAAVCGEALLALVPDAPDAAQWREYVETVWDYWWTFRDTDESTDHYNGLWFRYLLDWVEMRGFSRTFWRDRGVRRLMERYLYQVFPMGAFPHYSDSCGWNVSWGHWVWIFESCATAYRDGRYKWAAHRLYDYAVNRIEDIGSWGYTGEEAGWSLLKAYGVADDTIPERRREEDIALLLRHGITQRSEEERKRTGQFFDLTREMAPDKIVMHGGAAPDSLSVMLDVAPNSGHSHNRRPSVLALADRGSVLLMSLGYMDRRAEDHHMPVLVDYDGYPCDNTPYHQAHSNNGVRAVTVLDLGPVGYSSVRLDGYQGYPAILEREIVFVKRAGVLIKDTLTLSVDLRVRWGSVFRARNIGPDHGRHWVNTYLGEWVPLRGLGKNAPVLTRWRNAPRDLLIHYLPDPSGALELVDEKGTDETCPLPVRVQYALRQRAEAGAPVSTAVLLLPHPPGPAAALADAVCVLTNSPACTALRFRDPEQRVHTVVVNHAGRELVLPGLRVAAGVAYVEQTDGEVTAAALHGGKRLQVDGHEVAGLAPRPRAPTVPRRGFLR